MRSTLAALPLSSRFYSPKSLPHVFCRWYCMQPVQFVFTAQLLTLSEVYLEKPRPLALARFCLDNVVNENLFLFHSVRNHYRRTDSKCDKCSNAYGRAGATNSCTPKSRSQIPSREGKTDAQAR